MTKKKTLVKKVPVKPAKKVPVKPAPVKVYTFLGLELKPILESRMWLLTRTFLKGNKGGNQLYVEVSEDCNFFFASFSYGGISLETRACKNPEEALSNLHFQLESLFQPLVDLGL